MYVQRGEKHTLKDIIPEMKLIEKILMPYLDWIQIEVSGFCNASCFYCPHTTHRKSWRGRNITLQEFQKIVPYLKRVKLLHLQGWGEPFCNQDFFKFVEIAKKYGCQVGTTTNGMLIEDSHIEKIVDLNIDIIAFSLAGVINNDTMRLGTETLKIFKVIEKLNETKTKKGASKPRIHIAYMLLRSNFEEIYKISEFFTSKGIDHIQISFLDFIPLPELKKESVAPQNEKEFESIKNKALEVINEGRKRNLRISFNIPHPFKKGKCSENPVYSLFINSEGYVSPCVFTGIPCRELNPLYFGNIKEKPLPLIWREKEYKYFRKKHYSQTPPSICRLCPKIRIFEI